MDAMKHLFHRRHRDNNPRPPTRSGKKPAGPPSKSFAMVLCIDGVLTTGETTADRLGALTTFGSLRPTTKPAIRLLQSHSIPFILKTNSHNPFDEGRQGTFVTSLLPGQILALSTYDPFSNLHLPPFDRLCPLKARRCSGSRILLIADNPSMGHSILLRAGYRKVHVPGGWKVAEAVEEGQIEAVLVMSPPSAKNYARDMALAARALETNRWCHILFCNSDYDRVLGHPGDKAVRLDVRSFLNELALFFPGKKGDRVDSRVITVDWPDGDLPKGTVDLCAGHKQRQMEGSVLRVYDIAREWEVELRRRAGEHDAVSAEKLKRVYYVTNSARGEVQELRGGKDSAMGVEYEVVLVGGAEAVRARPWETQHRGMVCGDVLQAVQQVLAREGYPSELGNYSGV